MRQDFDPTAEVRLSVRIPKGIRQEFKAETARADLDMSFLVRSWVESWLKERRAQASPKKPNE